MTLAKLIQKGGLAKVATAIPAIPATQQAGMAATVARIATVAVAKPETATAWRWRMHYPGGAVEVRFSPEVSRGAALAACPGAIAAEPMPETPKRTPTEAEAAELKRLVAMVYVDVADQAEALAAALADPEAALICYRAIADLPGEN